MSRQKRRTDYVEEKRCDSEMSELNKILEKSPKPFSFGNQWDVEELLETYYELENYIADLITYLGNARRNFPEYFKEPHNLRSKDEFTLFEWYERYLK